MNKYSSIICLLIMSLCLTSCESEATRLKRERTEEITRIEREKREQAIETARIEREEAERIRKEILTKYESNSLPTGSTPYTYCFGQNSSCNDYGCSEIKVKSSYGSDVIVTVKKNDDVFRHAYIKSGSSYTFQNPNGTYQPFFYYGNGWNPEKVMKELECGTLKGGFVKDESFGKDFPQTLENNILEYELIMQEHGNFQTAPSNSEEAF